MAGHFILMIAALITTVSTQETNICAGKSKCGDCIATAPECAWCVQEGFDQSASGRVYERCDTSTNLQLHGCDFNYISSPVSNSFPNEDFSVRNAGDGNEAIQLQPQNISIKLRPNDPHKVNIMFRLAENYPVDLYYVMDLSQSMQDDKEKLAELGVKIAKEMSNITKNFRLGFGSFVDKSTMPYIDMARDKLIAPCTHCVPAYGFKNQLTLTDDSKQFENEVREAKISGNLDAPEGGFDAIMQAIACKKEIGWRSLARKLVIYTTDMAFHLAGEGKIGGIVMPNDGKCHLDNFGNYTHSLLQDYPSLAQIAQVVSENSVNVIFAVTQDQLPNYSQLTNFIQGSQIGALAVDSSNIVELVKDNYNTISSSVELRVTGAEDMIVSFKTSCLNPNGVMEERNNCTNIGIGKNVTFELELEVLKCPADRSKWKRTLYVRPVGLTEQLAINVELMCECQCESEGPGIPNSPHCNGTGTYICGGCVCPQGFFGKNCQCDMTTESGVDLERACIKPNSTVQALCEGHGSCLCGECVCDLINVNTPGQYYEGQYCECNNYACDYFDGQVCGGPERGRCNCGECVCVKDKYEGSDCSCALSNATCIASNLLLCNNQGTCNCGICTCDGNYRGTTCEDCPVCPGLCQTNKACVQCFMYESGPHSKEYCAENCTHIIAVDYAGESTDEKRLCQFSDDDDCTFYFTYEYNTNRVEAQRDKVCPKPVYVWGIVGGVIAAIVAIGIALLLIYKLFITISDRREFAKFEKERQNAKWDMEENPIFKQATTTFNNPTYAKKA